MLKLVISTVDDNISGESQVSFIPIKEQSNSTTSSSMYDTLFGRELTLINKNERGKELDKLCVGIDGVFKINLENWVVLALY